MLVANFIFNDRDFQALPEHELIQFFMTVVLPEPRKPAKAKTFIRFTLRGAAAP